MTTDKIFQIARIIIYALLVFYFALSTFNSFSQGVAINTNGNAADNSAMLDVSATNQGMLIPRMATANRPASPATGLIIYNTDCNELQYYNGTTWTSVINTSSLVAPTTTAGSGATATQITANWTVSTGATHYHLDVSTSNSFANFVTGFNNQDVSIVTSCNITGLTCGTTLYYRVRAENTCSTSGNSKTITYASSACWICGTSQLTDSRDNKTYNTVLIGSQCWMAQNINVGAYVVSNNTGISHTDMHNETPISVIEKYCYGNIEANCGTYGGLYDWAEMVQYLNGATNTTLWSPVPSGNIQGICPAGWHIPTDAEWCVLENTVEAGTDASCNTTDWRGTTTGNKLKTTGNGTAPLWASPSAGTNSSGFTALPSGCRNAGGTFGDVGSYGNWWTANAEDAIYTWQRYLHQNFSTINRNVQNKVIGFSLRCVKD
ncbi:MAG: hypothetical protein HGB12_09605 [Bacteroidetes bacterium]|nr:hypothetical protein [Bacteroidota bacterium]